MAVRLNVDTDAAFNTAHAVANDAEELREELDRLSREWRNISHGWSGGAASAYERMWDDWHEGATKLVETLAESSRELAQAAMLYGQQDTSSAQSLDAEMSRPPSADEMGL